MSRTEKLIAWAIVALTLLTAWSIVTAARNWDRPEYKPPCGVYDVCPDTPGREL